MPRVLRLSACWLGVVLLSQSAWVHAIDSLNDTQLNQHHMGAGLSEHALGRADLAFSLDRLNGLLGLHTPGSPHLLAMSLHHSPSMAYSETTLTPVRANMAVAGAQGATAMQADPQDGSTLPPSELVRKVGALIAAALPAPDNTLVRNLLAWQDYENQAPTGRQAQAGVFLTNLMANELGSERYSTRWNGNLPDVIVLQNDPRLVGGMVSDTLGNQVELSFAGNWATISIEGASGRLERTVQLR